MSKLLLALVLVASADALAEGGSDSREHFSCSTSVSVVDGHAQAREARRVSASVVPSVVFRGRVSPRQDNAPVLLFDVFNPRGRHYQTLVSTPRVVVRERNGQTFVKPTRTREAALAVAGSSIAWTSMYGKWRVEPRIEGTDQPCGKPQFFTIQP